MSKYENNLHQQWNNVHQGLEHDREYDKSQLSDHVFNNNLWGKPQKGILLPVSLWQFW